MMIRVLLHFHPNWPYGDLTVLEAMAHDGRYRSQWETGTSNGGLTAHPGGDRWRWERRLFEGRYDAAEAADRPVYGALDDGDAYGSAVRFGSSHFRLRPEVSRRTTFCFPDSVFEPDRICGVEEVEVLRAAAAASEYDHLDGYVEAQVHGGVSLPDDVEAVVLDPCFRGTPIERAAASLGCGVEWHPGFRVVTADLPVDYRGAEVVEAARELGDELDPAVLGAAARAGTHDPQTLKRVWHHLARFGRDVPGGRSVGAPS